MDGLVVQKYLPDVITAMPRVKASAEAGRSGVKARLVIRQRQPKMFMNGTSRLWLKANASEYSASAWQMSSTRKLIGHGATNSGIWCAPRRASCGLSSPSDRILSRSFFHQIGGAAGKMFVS